MRGLFRPLPESVEVGSYWICKPVGSNDIQRQDIIAKVLSVKGDTIHIMRKTCYGFCDISPNSLNEKEFFEYYQRLE